MIVSVEVKRGREFHSISVSEPWRCVELTVVIYHCTVATIQDSVNVDLDGFD